MCYIFSCFGWALDFIQRTLTFILACILCCFVCIGVVTAVAAGVAYGYNYSMAEFLTFTRHDTTVYMRRGQFYDKPDFDTDKDLIYARRSGGSGVDMSHQEAVDDQNMEERMARGGDKSLPESWSQAKDTRKYAEILTRYSPAKPVPEYEELEPLTKATSAPIILQPSMPAAKRVFIPPNPQIIPTSLMPNGASPIVMRNFRPYPSEPPSTGSFSDLEIAKWDEENGLDSQHAKSGPFYSDEEEHHRTKFFQFSRRPTFPDLPRTTFLDLPRTTFPDLPRPTFPDLPTSTFPDLPRPTFSDLPKTTFPGSPRLTLPDLPSTALDYMTARQPALIPMRHWAASKAPLKAPKTEPIIDYKEDIDEDNVVYKPI